MSSALRPATARLSRPGSVRPAPPGGYGPPPWRSRPGSRRASTTTAVRPPSGGTRSTAGRGLSVLIPTRAATPTKAAATRTRRPDEGGLLRPGRGGYGGQAYGRQDYAQPPGYGDGQPPSGYGDGGGYPRLRHYGQQPAAQRPGTAARLTVRPVRMSRCSSMTAADGPTSCVRAPTSSAAARTPSSGFRIRAVNRHLEIRWDGQVALVVGPQLDERHHRQQRRCRNGSWPMAT